MSQGPPLSTSSTRDLLLDTAERLFARRGIAAVSLREIGIAAGQRNNGVGQYHFGDKAGLVRSVFERRAAGVNQRRLELLTAVERNPDAPLRDVVGAHIGPLADEVRNGTDYVGFLDRIHAEHERGPLRAADPRVSTAWERTGRLLRTRYLPDLPTEIVLNRWRLAVDFAIAALADHQADEARTSFTLPLDAFVSELVDITTAMLSATSTWTRKDGQRS